MPDNVPCLRRFGSGKLRCKCSVKCGLSRGSLEVEKIVQKAEEGTEKEEQEMLTSILQVHLRQFFVLLYL
jgi:hypothetical protein